MAAILTKRGQNILTNQKEWLAASLAEMNTIGELPTTLKGWGFQESVHQTQL